MDVTTTPHLTHITMTGVDDHTDLTSLAVLSDRYQLAEWGFLYSPKRQGQGWRYTSVETLHYALLSLPEYVRVALHVCGAGVPNLLAGEPVVSGLVESVAARAGRIQLNFNQARDNIDLDMLTALLERFPSLKIIIQHNESNETVWERLCGSHANFIALFDSSGGRGIERSAWPTPLPGIRCGYAGGLGPNNLAKTLPRIFAAAGGHPHWIDMEGKLRRQDDVFDLQLAEACLWQATTTLLQKV